MQAELFHWRAHRTPYSTSWSYAAFAVARRRAAIQTAASAKAANTTLLIRATIIARSEGCVEGEGVSGVREGGAPAVSARICHHTGRADATTP